MTKSDSAARSLIVPYNPIDAVLTAFGKVYPNCPCLVFFMVPGAMPADFPDAQLLFPHVGGRALPEVRIGTHVAISRAAQLLNANLASVAAGIDEAMNPGEVWRGHFARLTEEVERLASLAMESAQQHLDRQAAEVRKRLN